MSKAKFYNLSALIILAVFQMRARVERTGGLLINGYFLTMYFYASKNYQRHIRTRRIRHIYLEI